ncbi:MAG TPA: TonB-dependent receptor [Allosphingosinicella sp.]|nr:TonB-dependent receptor [Allosphingosinicella sp.]
MYKSLYLIPILLAGTAPLPTFAQAPSRPADATSGENGEPEPGDEEEDIVVTGQPQRGAVPGDMPAEIQLDSRDIRAYGASNLTELLDALAPQTGSGRGRGDDAPVVLLNGRRISGFAEIRDLPPEAIERIDILPEEAALKFGYRADQRVVNFVLRGRFRAITGELEGGMATAGGRTTDQAEAHVVRIDRTGRWTIDAEYDRASPLLESERNIIAAAPGLPFDLTGNIGAAEFGAEIDPALSALFGAPITVAGVSASAAGGTPTLGDFSTIANVTDQRPFRTLLPRTEQYRLGGTYNRTIFGNVGATLNASYARAASTSRFGLASAALDIPAANPFSPFANDVTLFRLFETPRPLTRDSDSGTAQGGLSLNGDIAKWRWSFTANYDRVRSLTRTDTMLDLTGVEQRIAAGDTALNPFGMLPGLAFAARDRTRSISQSGDAALVASGPLLALPAGDATSTFKLGAEALGFDSATIHGGAAQQRTLSRNDLSAQASIDLPIASRRNQVLAAIGDLSLNANAAADRLSDFGTLTSYGGGLNWSPAKPIRIIASFTREEGAPTMQQLGDPVSPVPNVRLFDFLRGETVDITRIDGGNPALTADHRSVFKLGVTLKPLGGDTDLTIRADYTSARTRNMIASFPTATPEIEAAFPDRFERDSDGRLLSLDARPVNFQRAETAQIRWGFNFSKPIASRSPFRGRGSGGGDWRNRRGERRDAAPDQSEGRPDAGAVPPAAAQTGAPADAPAPQDARNRPDGDRGWRGGGFGRGGRGKGGRLQFALFHTWYLKDEVLIRDGVPRLDFLNGSAAGNGGGRPRHQIEAQAGISKDGLGVRLSANWQSGTTVRGDPLAARSDLHFSDLATVDFRLFADLGQQPFAREQRWLRGMRVSLKVNNLFDGHTRVRDGNGATPLSYQPDYLDPLGRSVVISLRKLFF